ncbi:Kinetochore-associated protein NNF1 [Purpureocillium lilacinum]|uniref:Kinetochore-associated protein NNF1 n=1 Tax=Purpureocillium lilacinum TaxID=33203 RepID=A0A179H484_PURLI|nr:mind kinetochore complex component protein [Purpureocillium lilacinum]PWI74929.1 Kinetochore-associated protein NNF1 [Purpureocillium lilacinum]
MAAGGRGTHDDDDDAIMAGAGDGAPPSTADATQDTTQPQQLSTGARQGSAPTQQEGDDPSAATQRHQTEGPSQPQQQQEQQPDSPPLPARHAPVAPGPRASRLGDIYAQALDHTLRRLAAWDSFAGCYPTVAARAEPVLRQVQGQMVDKMREKCEKEFDNILAARHVVPRLNELESLIADASSRRASSSRNDPQPTPPHLLPPDAILSAHLSPALAPHQSLLNARLQTSQARNALLADEVRRQRAEVEALLARLEAAVDDVHGANTALGAVAEELAAESRSANV